MCNTIEDRTKNLFTFTFALVPFLDCFFKFLFVVAEKSGLIYYEQQNFQGSEFFTDFQQGVKIFPTVV